MKPLSLPTLILLLAAMPLVAAVQDSPTRPTSSEAVPSGTKQETRNKNIGPRERVIAASLLPWRDPQPLLPRSGSALDELEAVQIERVYQQLRDDFSVADTGSNRGIEVRHAQQRFYESISGFIQDNPHSAWTQGLQIEMAKDEIQKGAYLAASENLKQVWEATSEATDEPSVGMAWVSANLLARNLALCGRFDELSQLETAMTQSPFKKAQGLHWARAKELQRFALANPEDSYKCGLFCLDLLTRTTWPEKVHPAEILEQKSSPKGWTAGELVNLAAGLGLNVDALFLPPTDFDQIPIPCIVHLNSEHFVYVEQRVNGAIHVVDPIAEAPQWMLPSDLVKEASGCILVAGGATRPGNAVNLRRLSPTETALYRGRCHGPLPNDRHDSGPCPNPALEGLQDCDACETDGTPAGNSDGSGGCSNCMEGMPFVRHSEPFLNPWVMDRPLSYQPAYGPKVSIDLSYNPRQTPSRYDPSMFNTGPNFGRSVKYTHPGTLTGGTTTSYNNATAGWSSSLLSHAQFDIYGNTAEVLLPGGRWADFDFPPGQNVSKVNYRHNVYAQKLLTDFGQTFGLRLWLWRH